MYDLINEWSELDILKETLSNFEYDKYYDHDLDKFEYVLSLTTNEKDEIFKFTVTFEFNKFLEKGKSYVYVDFFDARCYDELMIGNNILIIIEDKCRDFEKWLADNNYNTESPERIYANRNQKRTIK